MTLGAELCPECCGWGEVLPGAVVLDPDVDNPVPPADERDRVVCPRCDGSGLRL